MYNVYADCWRLFFNVWIRMWTTKKQNGVLDFQLFVTTSAELEFFPVAFYFIKLPPIPNAIHIRFALFRHFLLYFFIQLWFCSDSMYVVCVISRFSWADWISWQVQIGWCIVCISRWNHIKASGSFYFNWLVLVSLGQYVTVIAY